jgi:hypothetical protein
MLNLDNGLTNTETGFQRLPAAFVFILLQKELFDCGSFLYKLVPVQRPAVWHRGQAMLHDDAEKNTYVLIT